MGERYARDLLAPAWFAGRLHPDADLERVRGVLGMDTPFGNGFRCVGAGHRLPPLARSDGNGDATLSVDLTYGAIALDAMPGTDLHFQFWYRDRNGGGAGFNLTDGITVRMQ